VVVLSTVWGEAAEKKQTNKGDRKSPLTTPPPKKKKNSPKKKRIILVILNKNSFP